MSVVKTKVTLWIKFQNLKVLPNKNLEDWLSSESITLMPRFLNYTAELTDGYFNKFIMQNPTKILAPQHRLSNIDNHSSQSSAKNTGGTLPATFTHLGDNND